MSELPNGWGVLPLDIAATLIRGVSYKKNESSNESSDNLLPILRANNIQDGKLCFDDLVYIPADKVKDDQKVKANDIVIAMSSGSKKLVGKSGIATVDFNGGFGTFCGLLRPQKHFDARYIGHFTRSKYYADLVSSLSKGVNINNLKPAHFSEILVPIAPHNEQIRIANKLDSILAKVDKAQTRLDKIPSILKRFRQSVLAAATSGELTKEWRKDSTLVDIAKGYSVPESWQRTTMDDLSKLITSGSRGWAKYYSQEGSLFVRAQNINSDELILDDVAYVALPDKVEGRRTNIEKDDLLITITGANVTKAAKVNTDLDDAYVSQHVCLVKLHDKNLASFIEIFLHDITSGRGQLTEVAYGGGKPGLNLTNIKNLTIALPSIEEQIEIVRQVNQLLNKASKVEKHYLEAKARLDRLTQSALAKAFRGELVTQDPNDEPAEKLLERILAERELNKPKKVTRKRTNKTKTAEKE